VEDDTHFVHADRLDRAIKDNLALGDLGTVSLKGIDDVAGADRTVKLAGVRSLADELNGLAVDALSRSLRRRATLGIVGLDLGAIGFRTACGWLRWHEAPSCGKKVVAGESRS
jgi:hypothetical protein